MAGAELQSKLQQRLQRVGTLTVLLPRDGEEGPVVSRRPSDAAILGSSASPGEGGRGSLPVQDAEAALEATLHSQIDTVIMERDEACQQQVGIESAAVASGIELGAEVARLRVEVEILRGDLQAAQNEANKLRVSSHAAARRESAVQERSLQAGAEAAAARERRSSLLAEVAISAAEKAELEEKVRALEEEVASHVVSRVHLEAKLRVSKTREAELRRLLGHAEAHAQKYFGPKAAAISKVFALDQDDDDDEDGEGSNAGGDNDEDLEFTYEGLELSGLMSLERALELARAADRPAQPRGTKSGWKASESASAQDGPKDDASASEGSTDSETSHEDKYEAPLRALQLALDKIRGGGRGAANDTEGQTPGGVGFAGTGEAGEVNFDEQLGQLQEVLERLKSKNRVEVAKKPQAKESAMSAIPQQLAIPESMITPLTPFGLFSPYARLGRKYGGRASI